MKKKKFSLRWKILIPMVIGGICILIASLYCLWYAIYSTGNSLLDMKLTSDLGKITENSITIEIDYVEGYEGVYSDAILSINDESAFAAEFIKSARDKNPSHIIGGYTYSPEENAFILDSGLEEDTRLFKKIDSSFEGWHSGNSVVDLLFGMGSARFQTELEGDETAWLAVCQPVSPDESPRMICIGTDEDAVMGLNKYLTLVEGLTLLVIIAVIVVVILLILSRTTSRIHKVGNYLDGVGKGELPDEQLEIKSHDEIEDMSEIVNKMVIDLKDKQRIESELNMAAGIQLSMLPKDFPSGTDGSPYDVYAIMKPAKEVGGDFYDFFMPDDRHLAIIMADVSGKGVPAALFMVRTKTVLRSAINAERNFADIMTEANKLLCANNENGLFVTVWAGLLDLATGELTFCNAGHCRPLLKKGDTYEYLPDKHGTVMGLMSMLKYKSSTIKLEAGDKIFLYTDGVTEATNLTEDMFGKERLQDCINCDTELSTRDTVQAVIDGILGFVEGAEQFDDVTMMVAEYRGK